MYAILLDFLLLTVSERGKDERTEARGKDRNWKSSSIALLSRFRATSPCYSAVRGTFCFTIAYNEFPTEEMHHIPLRELARLLEYDSHDEEYLKEALRALVNCRVEWNVLNKDGKSPMGRIRRC